MRGAFAILAGLGAVAVAGVPAAFAQPAFVPPGKALGFNANLSAPGDTDGARTLDAAQAAGATHMRMVVSWRGYENESSVQNPRPTSFSRPLGSATGSPTTDLNDAQYLAIVNRGMTPLITVNDAPRWASTFHTCQENILHSLDSTKCPKDWDRKPILLYPAVDRFPAYRAFVDALVRRYPAAIFEGSNEPDTQLEIWKRYHPPVDVIARGQCELAAAVRAAAPGKTVLSNGMWRVEYLYDYLPPIAGRNCFDYFNLHQYAWLEVRTGPASAALAHLRNVRRLLSDYAGGKHIWVTETGMSNTVSPYEDGSQPLGEKLVAKAYPAFIEWWYDQPDIHGVFIHTVREGSFGETGGAQGFGLLTSDFGIKEPGSDILPRFCWLVVSAGNTYPGCEGRSLPAPPDPGPPTFYKSPEIPFSAGTTAGDDLNLLFLEEGEPPPDVFVTWYRCNSAGLSCVVALYDASVYRVTANDRLRTFKAVVTMRNQYGSVTYVTPRTPPIS